MDNNSSFSNWNLGFNPAPSHLLPPPGPPPPPPYPSNTPKNMNPPGSVNTPGYMNPSGPPNMRGRGFRGRGGGGNRGSFWRGSRQNFRGTHGGNFHGGNYRGGNSYGGYSHDGHRSNNSGGFRGGKRQFNDDRNANNWPMKPRREIPGKRLSETDIGVTEYISTHEGFNGIIKSRYADFQVSEIDEQGNIAKLTDLTPPTPPEEEEVVEDEELLFSKYNLEILPMETWDQVNKLAVTSDVIPPIEIDATTMSKEMRTKIHDAVKKAFGDSIVSSTVNIGDKKLVRFQKYRKGIRVDNRVKWVWPAEHVYFIVHKENCDTMEAASRIADRLRLNIKPSMLGYAGTKDRRAKTSQWFSLRKVDPRKIAAACKELRDIRVGNFEFKSQNLKLGMLKGNQFRIALRNVTASDELVSQACEELKEKGFINYYGLQRFGTRIETPTYAIGLKLLQGKFQEAIDGILEEREGPLQRPLKLYAESGAKAALKVWPQKYFHSALEVRLLRALANCPTDLLGALNKLARNTRLLYLHSYQSLIWNLCVSERVRRHGLNPAAGDIVPQDVSRDEIFKLEEEEDCEEDESEESRDSDASSQNDDLNKMAVEKEEPLQPLTVLETSIQQVKKTIPVKILTAEEAESGKYSIFDVIMPLPGHMIEYPPNMKDYYEMLLAKDGLNLQMKHKFKSYTMTGTYRHVVIRPTEVSWRCVRYTEPYADLILSDWDHIQNIQLSGIVEDGKYKALLLTMNLPASCYATMALRELLKVDTSCDNQAAQNNYHKSPEEQNSLEDSQKEQEGSDDQESSETKQDSMDQVDSKNDQEERVKEENLKVMVKEELETDGQEIEGKETEGKRKVEQDDEEVGVKKFKEEKE